MTVEQWLTMLDGFAFFFPSERAMVSLLKVYGEKEPVRVLTIDTRKLVRDYEAGTRLAAINIGPVLYKPAPRGEDTFMRISRFDHRGEAVSGTRGEKLRAQERPPRRLRRCRGRLPNAAAARSVRPSRTGL